MNILKKSFVTEIQESKYGALGTITMWWLLGGTVMGAWLIPCDLSHDHIGHTHRSCDRSHWISHAPITAPLVATTGGTPLDGTKVL